MPSAEAPTVGRVISKVASAPEAPGALARAGALELALQLLLAAQQVRRRGRGSPRARSRRSAKRGCRASTPCGRASGRGCRPVTTNEAWPRWPRSGSTVATTTVTSAMPPFEMKVLVPFRIQSSPSRLAVVRSDLTSEPADGSVTAYAPILGLSFAADHLGDPAADLLGRAGGGDAGRAQRGGGDRERDAGAAPVELLGVDDALQPLGVGLQGLDPVEAGELPLVGRLA